MQILSLKLSFILLPSRYFWWGQQLFFSIDKQCFLKALLKYSLWQYLDTAKVYMLESFFHRKCTKWTKKLCCLSGSVCGMDHSSPRSISGSTQQQSQGEINKVSEKLQQPIRSFCCPNLGYDFSINISSYKSDNSNWKETQEVSSLTCCSGHDPT